MDNATLRDLLRLRGAPFTDEELDKMSVQTALNWLASRRERIESSESKLALAISIGILFSVVAIPLYSIFLAAIIKLNIQIELKILIIGVAIFIFLQFKELTNKLDKIYDKHAKEEYLLRCIFISTEHKRLHPESKELAIDLIRIDLEEEAMFNEANESINKAARPFWLSSGSLLQVIFYSLVMICTWILLHNWHYLTKLSGWLSIYDLKR